MCKATRSLFDHQFALVLVLAFGAGTAIAQTEATKPANVAATPKKASIYDRSADALAQVDKATATARREHKRILVMFGGDWCGWCHKLHELFASDGEIRKILSDDYLLVMVESQAPSAEALQKKCADALSKEELQKGIGYPFLGVLDADGKVVTALRTDLLEEGDHHDPKRVKEFLNRWSPASQDAQHVLKAGLSRAASEDKLVFLTFGAPWCGWCHKLGDWMAQPEIAAILDRDFVITRIDIDRMPHGKELLAQVNPKPDGGIPWFADPGFEG